MNDEKMCTLIVTFEGEELVAVEWREKSEGQQPSAAALHPSVDE